MFSKVISFFVTIEHYIEAIISDFTKTITKLETAASTKASNAEKYLAEASEIAKTEAQRAAAEAAKIKALVS